MTMYLKQRLPLICPVTLLGCVVITKLGVKYRETRCANDLLSATYPVLPKGEMEEEGRSQELSNFSRLSRNMRMQQRYGVQRHFLHKS